MHLPMSAYEVNDVLSQIPKAMREVIHGPAKNESSIKRIIEILGLFIACIARSVQLPEKVPVRSKDDVVRAVGFVRLVYRIGAPYDP